MSLPNITVKYDAYQLQGGLDQVTPTLSLPAGVARRAVNFEVSINGGYSSIGGYERFDGHARPSDAVYIILSCTVTGTIAVGNTVTGMTSAATGKVIVVDGGEIVVTRQTGTFAVAEGLSVAAVQQATVTSISGAIADGLLDASYKNLAADEYRSSITAVPGAGDILGCFYYTGKLYAWRNNVAETAAELYVSSASGWTQVVFGEEISFTNANTSVAEGDTLTQGGVTATVSRMVIMTGTLLSGTNTGRMVLTARAGGNFAAGAATSTGAGALTLSGAQTAITFAPDGKFRHVTGNFSAGTAAKRIYGADGKNRAFEFDGTHLVPIATGMTTDTPSLIVVHKQHLFLSFDYSLQFSGVGSPFTWTPVVGAGETGMPETITSLIALPGDQTSGALGVFTKVNTSILYGTGSSNFALTTFNSGAGAYLDTAQNSEQTYLLSQQGVMSLATTRDFGNFASSALTMNIRPFVVERLPYTVASGLNRTKGQYRVFFTDGSGLYMTMKNGKYMGAMPVSYTNAVCCVCEGEDQYGSATSYFGSTNGMVYEMDIGTSFDGAEIVADMSLVFNATGSHRVLKRYRKASLELSGGSYIAFDVGYDLAYKSEEVAQSDSQSYAQFLRASFWDSFVWDAFVWDGADTQPGEIDLTGTAENIAIRISSASDLMMPFTINTITTHYTPRRGLR